MRPTRRQALVIVLLLVLGAALWTGWLVWQVRSDLTAAESSARAAQRAAADRDEKALDRALAQLRSSAAAADDRTGGLTWSALTHLPWVGDDAEAVRAVSSALHVTSAEAAGPLRTLLDTMRTVVRDGGVDLAAVEAMAEPVQQGHTALARADRDLARVDTTGLVDALRPRFTTLRDQVGQLESALSAAADASRLLPDMLGGSERRDYLVAFLNNAEIRSSGGMPGSWAHVRAEKGRLQLVEQGAPASLGERSTPILPLTRAERRIFGVQLGVYYQDANFLQHLPRSAELMAARWSEVYGRQLDGVVTLDTVGMSYLLDGAGPIRLAGGETLTSADAVDRLLNTTYLTTPDPVAQDAFFADVARQVFDAVTVDVRDEYALVQGLGRAAAEGRFLVHSFHEEEQAVLAGKRVAGELSTAPEHSPEVDLGFDDATGSKMSYYLRYDPSVEATSCTDGVQRLRGRMTMSSVVTPEQATKLPVSIANNGQFGTDPGNQTVVVRIYGPRDGDVGPVRVDGEKVWIEKVDLDGRPEVNLAMELAPGQTSTVEWDMTSGPGQDGDVDLAVTPGILPGDLGGTSPSACTS